ncbi:E3 ubiquitin-protein ligase RNF180 [Octodon degus]|uniref:E3 ubiquitin-protein ligase RNF180 n=1 Tax=Octodon degus TaxID=10160 RepID=A0A6P6DXN7_OCTDE|nr:E3 ubiquitin-protein ligase RNF180 [Octodon degus]
MDLVRSMSGPFLSTLDECSLMNTKNRALDDLTGNMLYPRKDKNEPKDDSEIDRSVTASTSSRVKTAPSRFQSMRGPIVIEKEGKENIHFTVTDRHASVDTQDHCHVWHVNLEALPEWISCLIQKAQWTFGKLNCPFCGAHLGGFNFVSTPKCSCGQLAVVYLSKSWTDYQATQANGLMRPSLKYLSNSRIQPGCNKETLLTGGGSRKRLLNMAQNNNGLGRLTEALCLEVRSTYFQMKNKKLLFKAPDSKYQLFVPQLMSGRCTARAFHRKSHSLDLNINEKLTLLPTLYEIHSKSTAYTRLNETQPIDLSDLPLQSSKNSCSFQNPSSFDTDLLLQRFSVAPHETQTQRGREFQCGLEASSVYSDHTNSNNLTLLMDLPSAGRSMLETSDQEEHLSPLEFLRSASKFSLGNINQRLNKRERSKLRNLRKKQQRHERWLQNQNLNDEMSTDDDNEYAEEKDSYICAVCLDVYFNPYMCYPCHHIFCEPCLRTLAKDNPADTPCPLCRTVISRVFFQTAAALSSMNDIFPFDDHFDLGEELEVTWYQETVNKVDENKLCFLILWDGPSQQLSCVFYYIS